MPKYYQGLSITLKANILDIIQDDPTNFPYDSLRKLIFKIT